MSSIQPDFAFSDVAAFPGARVRFRRQTGLIATLTMLYAGECDGCMGEAIEVAHPSAPDWALWLIYPVTGGVSFDELPAGMAGTVATVAGALDHIASLVSGEPA